MVPEKVLLWVILLDLLGNSFFFGVASSTIYKFNNQGWEEGQLACKMCGRMPSISKSEGGLSYHVSDPSLLAYSDCFWLGAVYDPVYSVSDDKYPSECCEVIVKKGNQANVDCVDCEGYYKLVCATDAHTVTQVQESQVFRPWKEASSVCTSHNFSLPLKNNSGLLDSLRESEPPLWTRSVLRLNINPNLSPARIPICYCQGSVQFFHCPQQLTTLCISETSTAISDSIGDFTTLATGSSKVSIFSSRTLSVNTNPANAATRRRSERVYAITSMNKEGALLSMNLSVTSYVNMSDFPRNVTEEKSIRDNNIIERGPTTWPILGGAIGAMFVFVIVVIIIIIITLRRRRMKNAHDAVLNSTTNNTPSGKVLTQTSLSYETIIGERFALEAPIATLPQASTVQDKGSVIYAQPHKVNQKSRNLMNNQFNITQSTDDKEKHGLYSKVQKEQKPYGISINPMESGGQGKECYNISSVESENDKYLGNVQVEQTSNVYDKANFYFEVLEIDTGNDYDKATFHRPQNSNYDTTYIANTTFDSTYDHLN